MNLFIHSFVRSFIHSFIHSLIHSLTHWFIHSFSHSFIHTYTHIDIHIYTYMNIYIYTYIYIFIHIYICEYIYLLYLRTLAATHHRTSGSTRKWLSQGPRIANFPPAHRCDPTQERSKDLATLSAHLALLSHRSTGIQRRIPAGVRYGTSKRQLVVRSHAACSKERQG